MADTPAINDPFDSQQSAAAPSSAVVDPFEQQQQPKGALESMVEPVTSIPSTFKDTVHQSLEAVKEGVKQLGEGDYVKGAGNVLQGGLGWATAPLAAPFRTLAGAPTERLVTDVTGSPRLGSAAGAGAEAALGFALPTPKGVPKALPKPVEEAPFGVHIQPYQREGATGAEQRAVSDALRLRSGNEAGAEATNRLMGQQAEVAASKDVAASQLHPTGNVLADDAYDAGQTISDVLARQRAEAEATRAQEAQQLNTERQNQRSSYGPNNTPQDNATIIQRGLEREEDAYTARRDAAYDAAKDAPGQVKPRAFTDVKNKVVRSLNDPDNPFLTSPEHTPNTLQALDRLDEELGAPAREAVDPSAPAFTPFTPSRIDNIRKILNSYWQRANQIARSTNNYSDVAGMSRVMDAFDDIVSKAYRNNYEGGNGRQVAQLWDDARAAHRDLRQTFSYQGKGDVAGPFVQKVLGQREGMELAPDQIVSGLTGSNGVQIGRRLLQIFGPDSPEVQAAKDLLYSRATEPVEGMAPFASAKVADNLDKLRNSDLGRLYFTPQERAAQAGHAAATRASVPAEDTSVLGRVLAKAQGKTPQELADMIIPSRGVYDKAESLALADHLMRTATDDEKIAIKQGLFKSLIENPAAVDSSARTVKRINDAFARGRDVMNKLYTPEDRAMIKEYRDLHQRLIPSPNQQWSNHPNYVQAGLRALTFMVADSLAHHVGVMPGMAEAVSFGAQEAVGRATNMAKAKQVQQLMKTRGEELADYQKAVNAANRTQLPVYQARAAVRGAAVVDAFRRLGINLSDWMASPVPASAGEPNQQRASGGAVAVPSRPFGGGIEDSPEGSELQGLVADPELDTLRAPGGYQSQILPISKSASGRYYPSIPGVIESGFTAPRDVATGAVPEWQTDPTTGETHTSPEMIQRAQDTAGMAVMPGMAAAEEGALGTTGGRLKSAEPAPPLYSAVEKAVQAAPQNKASAEQWQGYLKNQPGVKPDELDWIGMPEPQSVNSARYNELDRKGISNLTPEELAEFHQLDANPNAPSKTITKDQLLQHIGENKLQLEEKEYGKEDRPHYDASDFQDIGSSLADRLHPGLADDDARLDEFMEKSFNHATDLANFANSAPDHSIQDIAEEWVMNNDPTYERYMDNSSRANERAFEREVARVVDALNPGGGRLGTKYADYQMPGGENYRELLLKMPTALSRLRENEMPPGYILRNATQEARDAGSTYAQYRLVGDVNGAQFEHRFPTREDALSYQTRRLANPGTNARVEEVPDQWYYKSSHVGSQMFNSREEAIADAIRTAKSFPDTNKFQSSHWQDDPNVLLHMRMNDRDIPDAGFTLRNVNSGYKSPNFTTREEAEAWRDANIRNPDSVAVESAPLKTLHLEELQSDWHQKGRKYGYQGDKEPTHWQAYYNSMPGTEGNVEVPIGYGESREAAMAAVDPGWHGAVDIQTREVPIPSTNINERRVPDAPFKQSWPELGLKRAITKAAQEGYDAISWTPGKQQADRYSLSKHVDALHYVPGTADPSRGSLIGYKNGRQEIVKQGLKSDDLPEFIGKDAAQKLLASPLSETNTAGVMYGPGEKAHELTGPDLDIGGAGMRGFYDKMLPNIANKLGKKYGAQVEWKDLQPRWTYEGTSAGRHLVREIGKKEGWVGQGKLFDTKQEALDFINSQGGLKVPVLRLTPKLKEQALKGLPMFARGGAVRGEQQAFSSSGANPAAATTGSAFALGGGIRHKVKHQQNKVPVIRQAKGQDAEREQNRAAGGRVVAKNIDQSPSAAQKAAGNYAKDHVTIQGLVIAIENAKGHTRSGVSKDGTKWTSVLPAHYGYIKGTEGSDGDHVDVFVGPHTKSPKVWVVDQIDVGSKAFDEHKAFLGFGTKQQALNTYFKAFSDGNGKARVGGVKEMSVQDFKTWLADGDTQKPLNKTVKTEPGKIKRWALHYLDVSPSAKRCHNCKYMSGAPELVDGCGLYRMVNQRMPEDFDLDVKVSPRGYCDAWTQDPTKKVP